MTDTATRISITVNGRDRQVPEGLSVTQLLHELDLTPGTVVVERNREIVPGEAQDAVPIREGDRLELVHFVGGG